MTEIDYLNDSNFNRICKEKGQCVICPNDSIGKNFTCTLEYLRNVFHRCCQYFDSDVFGRILREDLMRTEELPFCKMCFSCMEKLFEMYEHLEKVQKFIADLVNSFTNEVLKNRDVESTEIKNNLNEKTLNESSAEIVNDWNAISNSVEEEYFEVHEIKTEVSEDENDDNNETSSISEADFDSVPDLDCEGDTKTDNQLESLNPQGNLHNFINTNGCAKSVVLKPLRIMLSRLHVQSATNKPKSRLGKTFLRRHSVLKRQSETRQARNKNIKTLTNRLLTRAKTTNPSDKTYKCRKCEDIFYNLVDVRNHIKDLHPNENIKQNIALTMNTNATMETVYRCSICSHSFSSRKKLRYHKQEHSQKLKCKVCRKNFKNSLTLANHMEIHRYAPYKCGSCDKTFNFKASLDRHALSVHSEQRPFECEVCSAKFKLQHNLYSHMKTHKENCKSISKTPSNKSYRICKCKICGESCGNIRDMRCHFKDKHPHEPVESVNEFKKRIFPNIEISYSCNLCSDLFKNYKALYYHKLGHTISEEKFVCTVCGKTLKSRLTLSRHMKAHSDSAFKCELCDKSFGLKENLEGHIARVHNDTTPFECDLCLKKFKVKQDLSIHIAYKHGGVKNKTWLCEDCGKSFYNKTDLRKHHRSVHKDICTDLFDCTMCNKKYTTNYLLKKHVQVSHKKEVSFVCDTCGKSMRNSDSLKFHMRLHTGEKPFQCSVCSKTFLRKQYLEDHMKAHSGEMFKCHICERSILNSSNFKKHMRKHNKRDQTLE